MKQLLLYTLIILLIPVILIADDAKEGTLTKVGQDVPAFKLTTIDDAKIDIKQLKGTLVLLNFFATWCPPCIAEMPHLEKEIWQKFKKDNFVVIAVGREHSTQELQDFKKKQGLTFPIAPDPKREIFTLFAKQNIPRNYLIDGSGKIIYQSIGYDEKEFKKLIDFIKVQLKKQLKTTKTMVL